MMEFDNSEYYLTNNDFSIRDGIYHVLVELTGPKFYSHEKLAELRKKLTKITGRSVAGLCSIKTGSGFKPTTLEARMKELKIKRPQKGGLPFN